MIISSHNVFFDILLIIQELIKYMNRKASVSFSPGAWYVGSLSDHHLWLLFPLFMWSMAIRIVPESWVIFVEEKDMRLWELANAQNGWRRFMWADIFNDTRNNCMFWSISIHIQFIQLAAYPQWMTFSDRYPDWKRSGPYTNTCSGNGMCMHGQCSWDKAASPVPFFS